MAEFPPVHAASTPERTRLAIALGMEARGWSLEMESGRELMARIPVRAHVARVSIRYDEAWIYFDHAPGENLGFDPDTRRVHPAYNRWVLHLRNSVAAAVASAESLEASGRETLP